MTAIKRRLKAKSFSGLISQILFLHGAQWGNQHSLEGSTAKLVVTVWCLLASADNLMVKTLEIFLTQSQQEKSSPSVSQRNKIPALSSKQAVAVQKAPKHYTNIDSYLNSAPHLHVHTDTQGGENRFQQWKWSCTEETWKPTLKSILYNFPFWKNAGKTWKFRCSILHPCPFQAVLHNVYKSGCLPFL